MSGNGVDLASIYQAVMAFGADMRSFRAEVKADMQSLRAELKADIANKADKDDVARLRQAVVEYHSAVIGHGVLISELDDRLRRVEQHLGLQSVT